MPHGVIPFPFGKCRICNDKATGVHYGVATCEGCKGFYKRSIPKGDKYRCYFGGNCAISPENRNRCKACRYKKCLDQGMAVEAVKMGRIPKIEKERALEQAATMKMEVEDSDSPATSSLTTATQLGSMATYPSTSSMDIVKQQEMFDEEMADSTFSPVQTGNGGHLDPAVQQPQQSVVGDCSVAQQPHFSMAGSCSGQTGMAPVSASFFLGQPGSSAAPSQGRAEGLLEPAACQTAHVHRDSQTDVHNTSVSLSTGSNIISVSASGTDRSHSLPQQLSQHSKARQQSDTCSGDTLIDHDIFLDHHVTGPSVSNCGAVLMKPAVSMDTGTSCDPVSSQQDTQSLLSSLEHSLVSFNHRQPSSHIKNTTLSTDEGSSRTDILMGDKNVSLSNHVLMQDSVDSGSGRMIQESNLNNTNKTLMTDKDPENLAEEMAYGSKNRHSTNDVMRRETIVKNRSIVRGNNSTDAIHDGRRSCSGSDGDGDAGISKMLVLESMHEDSGGHGDMLGSLARCQSDSTIPADSRPLPTHHLTAAFTITTTTTTSLYSPSCFAEGNGQPADADNAEQHAWCQAVQAQSQRVVQQQAGLAAGRGASLPTTLDPLPSQSLSASAVSHCLPVTVSSQSLPAQQSQPQAAAVLSRSTHHVQSDSHSVDWLAKNNTQHVNQLHPAHSLECSSQDGGAYTSFPQSSMALSDMRDAGVMLDSEQDLLSHSSCLQTVNTESGYHLAQGGCLQVVDSDRGFPAAQSDPHCRVQGPTNPSPYHYHCQSYADSNQALHSSSLSGQQDSFSQHDRHRDSIQPTGQSQQCDLHPQYMCGERARDVHESGLGSDTSSPLSVSEGGWMTMNPDVLSDPQMRESVAVLDSSMYNIFELGPRRLLRDKYVKIKREDKSADVPPTVASVMEMYQLLMEGIPRLNEKIIKFCQMAPGFGKLDTADQKTLLKRAYYDIWMLTSSEFFVDGENYLLVTGELFYVRRHMETFIGEDNTRTIHTFAQQFNALNLSHLEVAIMCCIQLTAPSHEQHTDLKDVNEIQKLNSFYLDLLVAVVTHIHSDCCSRVLVDIFRLVPLLAEINRLQRELIAQFSIKFPAPASQEPPTHDNGGEMEQTP